MAISALEVVTPASGLPITVEDAKGQLRVRHNFENDHIQRLIAAATSWAQNETRRIFVETVVKINMDRFPYRDELLYWYDDYTYMTPRYSRDRVFERNARDRAILLPGGRVTAVDQIDYVDTDGVSQTLTGATSTTPGTDYQEDLTDEDEAWIYPPIDTSWPSVESGRVNAVSVQYKVGFGDSPDGVPDDIKMAIRFRLADLYNIRDTADAGTKSEWFKAAENLLAVHRIQEF